LAEISVAEDQETDEAKSTVSIREER